MPTSDELSSDGIEQILEISRQEYLRSNAPGSPPGASSSKNQRHAVPLPNTTHISRSLDDIDSEITQVERQIRQLKQYIQALRSERTQKALVEPGSRQSTQPKGTASSSKVVRNYTTDVFPWAEGLKDRMRRVFGISSFRLCQEAVCNANLDGRDIIVVMPTGGGKSLTYQLPALLVGGCTVVISPLVALITDQLIHLEEAGVRAVMMTGALSKEQSDKLYQRMNDMASGTLANLHGEIKLCYVTPEKIAKSKHFVACLTNLTKAGKLARIVIDEAHCISQLGHDFRRDYAQLTKLRELCPNVPILALSATCPPPVLRDIQKTLRLKELVNGSSAPPEGTVYFSSPLYRKNLHYTVLPKPSSAAALIADMTGYILENHQNESGIVYCLAQKEAQVVAERLHNESGGKIKTGVYHAAIDSAQKEKLHHKWRKGEIQVVCATIAFGMGIDKGDVRFVIHHSISKSLDGFYQESGRAGRDGKDADCLLYYRPQDGIRVSSLVLSETRGKNKVYDMLRFAQDAKECRKIQFAKYFSASSHLSISSWSTSSEDALTRCNHCDNCTRPQNLVNERDVTPTAWKILRVVDEIEKRGGSVTLSKLSILVRGKGGGKFEAKNGDGGRKKVGGKTEEVLDVDKVASGAVLLSVEDTERLCTHLLITSYLSEHFEQTAYNVNVYLVLGPMAAQLLRHRDLASLDQSRDGGGGPKIVFTFVRKLARRTSGEKKRKEEDERMKGKGKGKERARDREEEDSEAINSDEEDGGVMDVDDDVVEEDRARKGRFGKGHPRIDIVDDDDDDDDGEAGYQPPVVSPRKRKPQKRPRLVDLDVNKDGDADIEEDEGGEEEDEDVEEERIAKAAVQRTSVWVRDMRSPQPKVGHPQDRTSQDGRHKVRAQSRKRLRVVDDDDGDESDEPPVQQTRGNGDREKGRTTKRPVVTIDRRGKEEAIYVDSESE